MGDCYGPDHPFDPLTDIVVNPLDTNFLMGLEPAVGEHVFFGLLRNTMGEPEVYRRVADTFVPEGGDKGVLEVLEVAVDGAPAREPAHHPDALFLGVVGVVLAAGVLIAADEDRRHVLPDHEDILLDVPQKILLKGMVVRGVGGWIFYQKQGIYLLNVVFLTLYISLHTPLYTTRPVVGILVRVPALTRMAPQRPWRYARRCVRPAVQRTTGLTVRTNHAWPHFFILQSFIRPHNNPGRWGRAYPPHRASGQPV